MSQQSRFLLVDKERKVRLTELSAWKEAARAASVGDAGERQLFVAEGLRKQFVFDEVKQVEGEDQTLQFTISTGVVDRDLDTVNANGWKLESYQRNPVVLWAHDYSSPPVARAPAVWVEDNKLKSRAQFTPRDVNPFGHMVYRMLAADFLRATSVGFNPLKWQFNEERKFGVDFLEQELLEYSIVPVPANPEALIEARSAGIDVAPLKDWAERVLDTWYQERGVWVPRSKVERAFQLIESKQTFPLPGGPPAPQPAADADEGEPRGAGAASEPPSVQKRGRVLSAANEERIRKAKAMLEEVLTQLEAEPETETDAARPDSGNASEDEAAIELADGGEQEVSPGDVRDLLAEVLQEELASLTGRIT